jgi:hypothetical protein
MKRRTKTAFISDVVKVVPAQVRLAISADLKKGTIQALDDIKALFGPGGSNWIKTQEHIRLKKGDYIGNIQPWKKGQEVQKAFDGFCLMGGIRKVDGRYEHIARLALTLAIKDAITESNKRLAKNQLDPDDVLNDIDDGGDAIVDFNDSEKTTWKDIKRVLARAKQLVKKAPTK